jgi:hypothetical protein
MGYFICTVRLDSDPDRYQNISDPGRSATLACDSFWDQRSLLASIFNMSFHGPYLRSRLPLPHKCSARNMKGTVAKDFYGLNFFSWIYST